MIKLFSAPPRRREDRGSRDDQLFSEYDLLKLPQKQKSEQSSFWYTVEKNQIPQDDFIPHESNLDYNGPLPFGSYRTIGNLGNDAKPTCLTSIALDFWNTISSRQGDVSEIDTSTVVNNVHQFIDSGFTTFQLYNPNEESSSSEGILVPTSKQIFTEKSIYHDIIQETPSSVVNQCNLSTRINVPPLKPVSNYSTNYQSDDLSFIYKDSLVREYIGQSIKNIYGQANGCIDVVQVNYEENKQRDMSPYTFDVLNVLTDMQREGLIGSISGLNFPSNAMDEIESAGFSLDYNQFSCNLLDPSKYVDHKKSTTKRIGTGSKRRFSVSSPLAGGLLTNRYSQFPKELLTRGGGPSQKDMSPSELWHYKNTLSKKWIPKVSPNTKASTQWQLYSNTMMKALEDIAYKHQVSIASIAIRWSMQLDQINNVVVSSSLNSNCDDMDIPHTRHSDLRQTFGFFLDDEDLERLNDVSGLTIDDQDDEMDIDFNDSRLFL